MKKSTSHFQGNGHVEQASRQTANSVAETILVVDDESDVVRMVSSSLRQAGFSVDSAEDGAVALEKARDVRPAVIILDLMLPSLTGFEVCKLLKENSQTADIKIIMLTAKHEEVDRLVGFELGADDYVTKPFSVRELVHRVKSVLRRVNGRHEREVVSLGPLRIDYSRCCVYVNNAPVSLTPKEFKLLAILAERPGKVQSRETLLYEVWGDEDAIDSRSVDTYFKRLRTKLGSAAECVKTVHGFGYRISVQN
jgi:two-component system phosphate regulon response regulator PhoB